ncbi:PstS family phosphate ABC transporter substrate-binding protein [Edaphobacter bradus]|uniref:PstS family phosphate ABC transporter substrate-binding protein n=1 Tax=Edaphobacter bradus TaxID=2259016 RepID=UPI0021E060D0|nr:substrate-binding domain-containing protein [Edaphobacter bradus]
MQKQGIVTIRLYGYGGMDSLVDRWERGFMREHGEVRFTNTFHGAATAMAGLYTGVADISVMGRELWPNETMAYRWVFQYLPFGVEVVTSALTSPDQTYTPVVIANATNPIASLTLRQLAGIYGSEHRRGGGNLRVWGDLGLTGEWANRPIHVYGYGPDDPEGVNFRKAVFRGDFKPNVEGRYLSDRDGKGIAAARIAAAVAADPLAIGLTGAGFAREGLKLLPVAKSDDAAAVAPTSQTVADRSYPLTRTLSFYVRREPGKPIDPALAAFLRYILSPVGQEMVREDGRFAALTPAVAAVQVQSLQREMPTEEQEIATDAN